MQYAISAQDFFSEMKGSAIGAPSRQSAMHGSDTQSDSLWVYMSQCFKGKKKPSFDRAIQLAKILRMTHAEMDALLAACQGALYFGQEA